MCRTRAPQSREGGVRGERVADSGADPVRDRPGDPAGDLPAGVPVTPISRLIFGDLDDLLSAVAGCI